MASFIAKWAGSCRGSSSKSHLALFSVQNKPPSVHGHLQRAWKDSAVPAMPQKESMVCQPWASDHLLGRLWADGHIKRRAGLETTPALQLKMLATLQRYLGHLRNREWLDRLQHRQQGRDAPFARPLSRQSISRGGLTRPVSRYQSQHTGQQCRPSTRLDSSADQAHDWTAVPTKHTTGQQCRPNQLSSLRPGSRHGSKHANTAMNGQQ
ncbi:hypothetical protein E6O75_ATG06876 [Venturia nashicola]|uniref:Uncharacterized protein n=1 Tax=Venturia nashicola TaxID=86259 RepID=A0A4Z1P5K7_9PEZI|nr:hypothetical protein E6O75_ATG06876 [Venturia nashicola]